VLRRWRRRRRRRAPAGVDLEADRIRARIGKPHLRIDALAGRQE
jgi:hypothetical protein